MTHSPISNKSNSGQPRELPLTSPVDGLKLFAAEWPTSKPPVGVICLVHGMGEHHGRQDAIVRPLNEAGFTVFVYDQRGHGRSGGKRGHASSITHLTHDTEAVLAEARRRYPELPLFLYGHSMGGNVAVNYALRHESGLAGLVLSSPWLRLAFTPPKWKVTIGRAIGRIWPTFTQSAGLASGSLYRPGHPNPAPPRDEWSHGNITAAMFVSMTDSGEWAIREASRLHIPLLLVHGTADRITSFEASQELMEHVNRESSTFMPIEGGYHELYHDPEGPDTMERITAWLLEQAHLCT
ncbi:alpha-beta hydrolase superfamily lysophospholipase [Paenibacillus cellulosilyticus]|uniref:Alpha-beta hydrolase superfamily lysophospholipase n=1 Tax=Paenibacillus cellulosilyticus TaxID=375489 RepID=A0A2V2YRS6_9BACL|nr:alpha/beta hydrolase [Paenibacillus cellulosilyticus]PWV97292.1 alpha-beta hydrolase superfamily lysophospholipase [Paenibacillus cellulosilyticus]QKS47504.1 lysophospholipase [Paenibacillus cellulosilyticus]